MSFLSFESNDNRCPRCTTLSGKKSQMNNIIREGSETMFWQVNLFGYAGWKQISLLCFKSLRFHQPQMHIFDPFCYWRTIYEREKQMARVAYPCRLRYRKRFLSWRSTRHSKLYSVGGISVVNVYYSAERVIATCNAHAAVSIDDVLRWPTGIFATFTLHAILDIRYDR